MTKSILPHWYREKRSKLHRKIIYQFLKLMGIRTCAARAVRDWSNNHIKIFITENKFCQVKDERIE